MFLYLSLTTCGWSAALSAIDASRAAAGSDFVIFYPMRYIYSILIRQKGTTDVIICVADTIAESGAAD